MAKATPARITYFIGGDEQDIRFHEVMVEGHQATSEITKFPVQKGFQVSNHAIRKNRVVTIEAIITNTVLVGAENAYEYSLTDNSKTIFNALRDLVNLRIKCTVLTNLGEYTPVLFNSFKTKQVAGMVDSMKVILVGEELQVSNAVNGAAPTPISFTVITDPARSAKVGSLESIGVSVAEDAVVSEGSASIGGDFTIRSTNDLNQTFTTTYLCKGYDPTTGTYSYDVHTTDIDKYTTPEALVESTGGIKEPLSQKAGAQGLTGCAIEEESSVEEIVVEEVHHTAAGDLKQSSKGAFYSTMTVNNSDVGQELIGLSAGCAVISSTSPSPEIPYEPGETIPSATEVISGAKNVGTNISNDNKTPANVPLLDIVVTQVVDRKK